MGDAGSDSALRLLAHVTAALASGDLLEGLPEVAARVAERMRAVRVAVLALSDADATNIHLIAASDEQVLLRWPLALEKFPALAVAIGTRLMQRGPGPEPEPDPSAVRGELEEARTDGSTQLAVPLVAGGVALGCLTLRLPEGALVPDEELRVLESTAQIIAVALRGGRFLESLREQTRRVSLAAVEERRLKSAIEGYRDFFDNAADGVLVLDARGAVLHVNRAAEQATGYARTGLAGRRLFEIVPREQHADLAEIVAQSVAGEPLAGFDFDLITTSGERLRVSASTSAVLTGLGATVLSFRDVTEARALEDQLRKTRDFVLRLIDAAVDGVIACDMRGQVILFNQGAHRIFGWSAEEVVGLLPVWSLYPEGVAREVMNTLRAPGSGGRLVGRREVLSKSDERVPVQLAASIVYEDGVEVATIGVFSDLRERLRIEQSLADAQDKLLVSEKQAMLAQLAGAAAHELNQPLTSVMGYAELLLKRLPEEDANRRPITIVLREAERMAEIVRQIGRITRYETKPYVGTMAILDLEKSAGHPTGEPAPRAIPKADGKS